MPGIGFGIAMPECDGDNGTISFPIFRNKISDKRRNDICVAKCRSKYVKLQREVCGCKVTVNDLGRYTLLFIKASTCLDKKRLITFHETKFVFVSNITCNIHTW